MPRMKKLNILIGVVTRGADIHYNLVTYLISMIGNEHFNIGLSFVVSPESASKGQEQMFQTTSTKHYDYLLMIDSDVIPETHAIYKLILVNSDIAVAPVWHYSTHLKQIHLDVQEYGKPENFLFNPKTGIERVRSASFGCMLVKTKVLTKFVKAGEKFTYYSPILPKKYISHPSDSIFFAKCRKFGVVMKVNWDIHTEHNKRIGLSTGSIKLRERVRRLRA